MFALFGDIAYPDVNDWTHVFCLNLKRGLSIIPAQAGIQFPSLYPRLRGNDELANQSVTKH